MLEVMEVVGLLGFVFRCARLAVVGYRNSIMALKIKLFQMQSFPVECIRTLYPLIDWECGEPTIFITVQCPLLSFRCLVLRKLYVSPCIVTIFYFRSRLCWTWPYPARTIIAGYQTG
jgi:hypothetical protein